MSLYQIEPIDRSYSDKMLEILHSAPINTDKITICFDRQPDFFRLSDIKYHPYFCYGFFRLNQLKGFGMIGYHSAMVNGSQETVFHLKDFYVSPEARGTGFGLKVAEKLFRETYNNSTIGYAVVMKGNRDPLSYVDHRNPSFPYIPYSRIINQLDVRNIILTWPVRYTRKYIIRRAEKSDIPVIVNLLNNEHKERLFGNHYDIATFDKYLSERPGLSIDDYYLAFGRNGSPCGVCAAWDCSSFRQTRVLRYGKQFLAAKILYRILSVLFRLAPLPAPGECFKDFIVTDYAVEGRDPDIMNALLRTVYNKYRKKRYQNMIWSSSADDPLLKASDGFFFQRLISNIVLISTDPATIEKGEILNKLPYIDLPCL
jgi:GNAT superfamily N-acetyltransferase